MGDAPRNTNNRTKCHQNKSKQFDMNYKNDRGISVISPLWALKVYDTNQLPTYIF